MDLLKSTTRSVNCFRGFFLAMIVGRIKNYVIDSDVVIVRSRPVASSATIGSEVSVSIKKCCTEEARTSSKFASISPLSTTGMRSALLVNPPAMLEANPCSMQEGNPPPTAWCRPLCMPKTAGLLPPSPWPPTSHVPPGSYAVFGPKWSSRAFVFKGEMPVFLKPFLMF
jgi:hypothetical protein